MWELIKDHPGDVATWMSAFVAFMSAIATIWWPWITRPRPSWFPVLETDSDMRANPRLSGFDMFFPEINGVTIWPQRIIRMYNAGAAPAYGVFVEPKEAVVIEVGDADEQGSKAATDNVAMVPPGGFFYVALMHDRTLEDSFVRLYWSESPTSTAHMYVQEIPVTELSFGRVLRPSHMGPVAVREWKRRRLAPRRYPVDMGRQS